MHGAPSTCDVLIVGAGPAGSCLGWLLAGRGLDVAIIDRARFPRDKVCAGVSRKSIDLLDLMGLDVRPVVQRTIRGAVLSWGNRDSIVRDLPPPAAFLVVRRDLDRLLLDRARDRGVRVLEETAFESASETAASMVVSTSRGDFRCGLLVGADGAKSAVRDALFGRDAVRYVPSLEAIVPLDDATLARFEDRAVFDLDGMPGGYGWIFPKRDHANVGVFAPFGGKGLRPHLDAFIARYRTLRGARDVRFHGAVIPIRNRHDRYQQGRTWLVGDAAGLAEALFGEGIFFAVKSAMLAAEAIVADGIVAGSPRYHRLLEAELLPELRAAEWMARLVYACPRAAFRHLALNPRINHRFAGMISGATGYRQCVKQTLLDLPRWVLPAASQGHRAL